MTKVSIKQRKARKRRGVKNSELAKKRREEKEQSAQSEEREERDQESRPPECEPAVETGNEIENEVLETAPEGS
jgi:hypothetical protein